MRSALTADAVPTAIDNWYSLAAFAMITIGGWVTVILKQHLDGKKLDTAARKLTRVSTKVDNVDAQVTNGGSNLAANVGDLKAKLDEVVRISRITRQVAENLQDHDIRILREDISSTTRRLDTISEDIRRLGGELSNERTARTSLEKRFNARQSRVGPQK